MGYAVMTGGSTARADYGERTLAASSWVPPGSVHTGALILRFNIGQITLIFVMRSIISRFSYNGVNTKLLYGHYGQTFVAFKQFVYFAF